METANHEYYVSLEISKLLKKAGFDWKCSGIYVLDSENDPEYVFSTANFTNTSKEIEGYIRVSAPTLDIAQRWLREVKNIHIEVSPNSDMSAYAYSILLSWDKFWLCSPSSYSSYEEAQEEGIKQAIEMILEKGE